jgi:hypothetical protein
MDKLLKRHMTIKLECFITFIINEPDLNKKLSISQQLNDLKSWTAIIYIIPCI